MTDVAYSDSDKSGSTKVNLTIVEGPRPDGRYFLQAGIKVVKAGIAGVGKGFGALIVFDVDGNKLLELSVGETVGANFLEGVADKSSTKSVVILPNLANRFGYFLFNCDAQNNDGIISDISELIRNPASILQLFQNAFGEVNSLLPQFNGSLPLRESINLSNGWSIVKIN